MAEAKLDFRLVDRRVFAVTLVFGVVAGFEMAFDIYLHVFLIRSMGVAAFGYVNLFLSSLYYVFNPVLYFIVLYLYCGGSLLNRMARVLISIVFGSMLGFYVGYLAGGAVWVASSDQPVHSVYSNLALSLPQYVIGQLLVSFGILAFSDLIPRWEESLKISEKERVRPGGLVILVAIYVISALLNILAIPLVEVYIIFTISTALQTLVATVLLATLGISIIGQLVLAIGLYRGRKWAWILAIISSATSVLIDACGIGIFLVSGLWASTGGLLTFTGLFVGFLISLAILSYLMSTSVRRFFKFVNQI
jgi:hypothetical protein